MMFNATKLKVQLKLAVNRLKMLQNKKASINAQQRKEIATLLEKGKEDSARIRVEHIIREDYDIEAMEMMEIYCEMLLARFGLIEQMKQIDPSIQEAAASVIYAAPRCADCKELMVAKEYLGAKYGKEFVMKAAENKDGIVNERLVNKLKVKVPDQKLVTRYLIEIAKNYNVAWTADEAELDTDHSLMGDSTLEAEFSLPSPPKAAPTNQGPKPGGGGGGPSGGVPVMPTPYQPPAAALGRGVPPLSAGLSAATISSVGDSTLDSLFPSVPGPSGSAPRGAQPPAFSQAPAAQPKYFANAPPPAEDEKEQPEPEDDGNMPDFDELTKRFEALKRRQ